LITIFACDTDNIQELITSAGYTVNTTTTFDDKTVYEIIVTPSTTGATTPTSPNVQIVNPGLTKVELADTLAHLYDYATASTTTGSTTLDYPNRPTKLIITGNCASVSPAIRIGTMALAGSALQHDVDFRPVGLRAGVIPQLSEAVFSADSTLLTSAITALKSKSYTGRKGRFASGDQVIASGGTANRIKNYFGAYFIDTETGSLAEMCSIKSIPWVSIKGVSNYANAKTTCLYNIYGDTANTASLKVALAMLPSIVS
jgi:nucleoside phosphorylase